MRSAESHRRNNLKCYHKRRSALIARLGGCCSMCGSTEKLEFDHIDSNKKKLAIAKQLTVAMTTIDEELKNCQLLCHSCHMQKTKQAHDGRSKITAKLACDICKDYANSGQTQIELGKKYGLAQNTISAIIKGKRWSRETFDTRKQVSLI